MTGIKLGPGQEGEIMAKTPTTMLYYLNRFALHKDNIFHAEKEAFVYRVERSNPPIFKN